MAKESILVGMANEGELSIPVEKLKTWVPTNISYFSDIVYFKHEDAYFSMKRMDFKEIFNK
jgi:hypothetical protein